MKTYDCIVVGGGIAGCSVAYYLAEKKPGRILLLEASDRLGSEASRAGAGILNAHYSESPPGDYTELCFAALGHYPEFAAAIEEESGIDIELLPWGLLDLIQDDAERMLSGVQCEWLSERGAPFERLDAKGLRKLEPAVSETFEEAVFFPEDKHVNNDRMIDALGGALAKRGVEVRLSTRVTGLRADAGRASGIEVDGDRIETRAIVIAAGSWSRELIRTLGIDIPMKPVRGQMAAFQPEGKTLSHVVCAKLEYLVPRKGGEVIAGSTMEFVDFNKETTEEGIASIRKRAAELCPALASLPVERKWAGLRPYSTDGAPILGPVAAAEGIFLMTGHSRKGLLLGPLTGKLLAEMITTGKTPALISPFLAKRFKI